MSKKVTTILDDRLHELCEIEANLHSLSLSSYLRDVLKQRHSVKGLPIVPIKIVNQPTIADDHTMNGANDTTDVATWTCSNCDVNWTDADAHCSDCHKPRESIDVLRID